MMAADCIPFLHPGGAILDEDGNRRYFDDDPPGWYFWSEDPDGVRRLHGPYDSMEAVDEEMDHLFG